jgi:hypothetical protein
VPDLTERPIEESRIVSLHVDAVIHTLHRNQPGFLPRGELFIDKSFLDHFFGEDEGDDVGRMERAARSLGLSLIGIDLGAEGSDSLLSERSFRRLESYFTVGCLNGPVSALIEGHGFFAAMASLKRTPSLFSRTGADLLKEVERKARLARANGMRAVAVTDDIAGNKGLLFSPDCFVDLVWPVYKGIAEIIKGEGLSAFFHSDGDMRKVIELLIRAGYDCIHPVDGQAGVNLYEMTREFGERIAFMGHIDIMAWSEEQIRREVNLAEDSFKNGGLILGSTCGISMKTLDTRNNRLGALHPRWAP